MVKVYVLNSDKELNEDFGMADNDNKRDSYNEQHIPRSKVQPIKNNRKNKPSSPKAKETSLRATYTKETNEEDKYETMDTSYKK